ncbi:MAG: DUF3788 domain-containing protein [Eubacteriales bacterium]|nr:DUF3788 domain-containing protein [Eubacteriales bacterium]
MIEITDKTHQPSIEEIKEYIDNPLFTALYRHMQEAYQANVSVEYSGDKVLLGWNVKFYKAGRTLLRLYPKRGLFNVLVVIGKKEKERAEAILPELSCEGRKVYETTQEGMGQRWLLFTVSTKDGVYNDVLRLVEIRRNSK